MTVKGILGWLIALTLAEPATGSMIHKCVGTDGRLTYTHGACPDGSPGQPHWVYSPLPGSITPKLPAKARSSKPVAARSLAEPALPSPLPASKAKAKAKTAKKPAQKKKPPKYTPWRS
jgi:hypothetical protein